MSYGSIGYVGLAKETNWGSGQAATEFVEALTENITLNKDRYNHKNIIGSLAEPDDSVGLNRVGGSISFAANPVAIGHFLRGVLGTQSTSVVTSGSLWTHQFATKNADFDATTPLPPYSVEVFRDVGTAQLYGGGQINGLTFTIANGQAVQCDAAFILRNAKETAQQTPTFPGSPSKPFAFDTVSLSLGGAANAAIEALTIGINNNLQGIGTLNLSSDIGKIRRNGHQMISVNGSIAFDDVTEYDNFKNQTEQRLAVSMTKANSFQMVIDIPKMVYTSFPLGIPGSNRLLVNFNGKGFYHSGSGNAIKVTLTTVKSNY